MSTIPCRRSEGHFYVSIHMDIVASIILNNNQITQRANTSTNIKIRSKWEMAGYFLYPDDDPAHSQNAIGSKLTKTNILIFCTKIQLIVFAQ